MKSSNDEQQGFSGNEMTLEALLAKGRKLHDMAVFSLCTSLFRPKKNLGLTKEGGQDQVLISHYPKISQLSAK